MGDNVRRQALQVDELLDEREGGRDHRLRGDELYGYSVADIDNATRGRTHRRHKCKDINNPVLNKHKSTSREGYDVWSSPVERSICTTGDGQVKYVGYDLVSRDDKSSTLAKVCKDETGIDVECERELQKC